MNKFNLTFSGGILPGHDPERVKAEFGTLFNIDDPARIDQFFAGQNVILRRDLDRKAGGTLYAQLHKLGADVTLEKILSTEGEAGTGKSDPPPKPASSKASFTEVAPSNRGMDHEIREAHPGRIDQSWAVSSARINRTSVPKKTTSKSANKASTKQLQAESEQRKADAAANRKKILEQEAKREAEEDAEREKALAEEAAQKAREEAARQRAEEQARREAEQEAARKRVEAAEEAHKKAEQEAARQKAEERARREAEREAARKRAEAEEVRKKAEQEAARQKAEEQARREAEQEAARKRAEAEARRQAEHEAAQRKAREEALAEERRKRAEELKRIRAEEAEERAREKARALETRRRAAEAAALEKARKEAARQEAAEEAARVRAENAELRRKMAEETAQIREAEKKKKAEERARIRAEQTQLKAEEKARKLEEKHKAEAEAEKQLSLTLEAKRTAAEEVARHREERAKLERLEAEEIAREKAEQQRKHAEEFERLKQLKAAEKAQREALERAAREKAAREVLQMEALQAEQRRLEAEEIAREQGEKLALLESQLEAERAKASKPIPHSIGSSHSARNPVKTALNVPTRSRQKNSSDQVAARPARKLGAPNFFNLRPFRNTADVRQRAERSRQTGKVGFVLAVGAFFALAILSARFLTLPKASPQDGASAMAVNQNAELLLIAGDRLFIHDRSGTGIETISMKQLGLVNISSPLAFSSDRELLVLGQPQEAADENEPRRLMLCNLAEPGPCSATPFPDALQEISGMALDPLSGTLYLADSKAGLLFKMNSARELVATVSLQIPERAAVRLDSGLIYLNSTEAAAISVYRPDDQAFGQKLDEILLMPPPALAAGHSRVADFIRSGRNWWVTLINPDSLDTSIYRFDDKWNFIDQPELMKGSQPEVLLAWAGKTLILDSQMEAIQRFNANGEAETALYSESLLNYVESERQASGRAAMLWRLTLGFLATLTLAALSYGSLHRLRDLVYKRAKEHGAEPVGEYEKTINWVPSASELDARVKLLGIIYTAVCLFILGSAVLLLASPTHVFALATLLTGPVIAFFLYKSSPHGHIGMLDDRLVLVDHKNYYHLGRGPGILYRAHFLMIDDVVVFTGTRLLPVFNREQLAGNITPVSEAGIKVDRKTVMVKLLQAGHPLARGALACAVAATIAALILLVSG